MRRGRWILAGLRFDVSAMGPSVWTPIAAILGVLGVSATLRPDFPEMVKFIMFPAERFLTVFAAWWSIYLLQYLLEFPGGEVFLTCPVSRWYHGTWRVFRGYLVFAAASACLYAVIHLWMPLYRVGDIVLMVVSQSFFFAGLGFCSMAIIRHSSYAMAPVAAYSLLYVFGGMAAPSFTCVYVLKIFPLPAAVFAKVLLPRILVLSAVVWLGGQWALVRYRPRMPSKI